MDCCAQSACLRCPRHWGRWKAAEFPASFLLTRPSTPANWSCISLSNPRFSPLSETPGRALSPSRREVLPDLPPALRTNTHLCSHRLQDPGSNACTSQRLQLHQLGSQMTPSLDGAEEPSWASRSPARSRLVRCLDKGAAAAPPKSQSAREGMAWCALWWRLPSLVLTIFRFGIVPDFNPVALSVERSVSLIALRRLRALAASYRTQRHLSAEARAAYFTLVL